MTSDANQEISQIKGAYITLATHYYERASQWREIRLATEVEREQQEWLRKEQDCLHRAEAFEKLAKEAT